MVMCSYSLPFVFVCGSCCVSRSVCVCASMRMRVCACGEACMCVAVAKLLGKILKELGLRSNPADPTDTFIHTTGEKLARIGAQKAQDEIQKAVGGVLFIDEAYGLEPGKNADAAAVALQLLDAAEEERERLTIILAGYKQDIETKLFDFNDGFNRRFNYKLAFEDYTEGELAAIFERLCAESKWPPSDPFVVTVAARRAARGGGNKGFGNAGAVRNLFETAYRRALARDRNAQTLTVVDILGPAPDRSHVPDLGLALDELDKMIGLESVKRQVGQLVQAATTNYDREIRGEKPYPIPPLNRVFLGNPGTGKTTLAKLYGRILKGIGFLTNDQWELKLPSDFVGSHVGESRKKTAALLNRCEGKILIIDEAYGLASSTYGLEAIDEIVSKVHGAPGEDIAVVMIGYEKQMKKMFRDCNPGLASRFSLDAPFIFEDFSDRELEDVVQQDVRGADLTFESPEVRRMVVKALAAERLRPHFGNARAAVALTARAKERLVSRDATFKALTLDDFGLEKTPGDWRRALMGLSKVGHIEAQLTTLKAVLEQCDNDGSDRSEHLKSYTFLGNPGTGKSTVAAVFAQMLTDIGMLASNKVVRCNGLDLQGSHVGQTKDKVNELMDEAMGGVLFIDEAYTLGGGADRTVFAQEAMDQLVGKMTEEEHLNRTVVILAGYREPMERMMASANEGAKSRFTGRIEFPDWDAADCEVAIRARCERERITLLDAASQRLRLELEEIKSRPGWSNARDCGTMYKFMYESRALRRTTAAEAEPSFVADDVEKAAAQLRAQRPFGQTGDAPRPLFYFGSPAPQPSGAHHAAFAALTGDRTSASRPHQQAKIEEIFEEAEALPGAAEACGCTRPMELEDVQLITEAIDPDESVYAALLHACVEAGYDSSHEKRQQLIGILEAVESGDPFPGDIMERVLEKTNLTALKATKMLRPQVHMLLEGMRHAVQAEDARLAELRRLEEEERLATEEAERQRITEEIRRKQEEQRRVQQRLAGKCPMGYSWHVYGSGWRCAGGSHFVSNMDL
jgi:AAA+ superfamily predicted ATPase